ncbi:MAG: pyridoxal phosphate-dependent aminotransferase [Paracoccus sp. (in: a-proteobacteria)]|nr:pyridoxal phosphate-dependent aminotransferase [Paracoccus sp. (in: a-proteobacteria)]
MRFAPIPDSLPATVPFVGPDTLERRRGAPFRARIGANENGFGPSPRAVQAMQRAASEVWKYGDSESHDLRMALAAHERIDPAHIMIGEGIDALLGLLVRLIIAPGDAVVTSDGAYPTFNYHVAGFGGVIHKRPYRDDHEDLAALMARAHETRARLIYFANPDNPMGSWHDGAEIRRLLDHMPPDCLLILDEAYAEFAPPSAIPRIDPADPRVIRMRTFSKAYALAGLRVGYAIGAAGLMAGFDRIRNHFGVNLIAQAAALGALADRHWLDLTREKTARARDRLARIAAAQGLHALPSATNFVAIDCGEDGDFARRVLAGLEARGIFARMPGVAPLDRCIRISCAPDPELDLFAAALPPALEAARKG